jgi:hypothetical protein
MDQATAEECRRRIQSLVNEMSIDNAMNIPDYIIAHYLIDCLMNLNKTRIFLNNQTKRRTTECQEE